MDEVACEVLSLNVFQIVFSNSYLYDRYGSFDRREQMYKLKKNGINYQIRASTLPKEIGLLQQYKPKNGLC